jgi:hypothetical protein
MRAMTAAPMRPAAPSWAACVDAALLVDAAFEVVVPEPVVDEALVVVLDRTSGANNNIRNQHTKPER